MYIIGYYKASSGDVEFGDNSFRTINEAAERIEEIFENTTGKDINFSNILTGPVDVIGELYQYTVAKKDNDSVIIKFYTREKNKGYIYNTFTEFHLDYTFFIKKTPPHDKSYVSVITESDKKPEYKKSEYINPFTVLPGCGNNTRSDIKDQLIEELKLKFKSNTVVKEDKPYSATDCSLELERLSINDENWALEQSDYINKYLRKRRKRIRTRDKRRRVNDVV
jgi:hypothetical protein